uniref:Uncharacterized protein n=1 Tax=Rhizophora mucronata TaxID=61149 RepID=A0A2P2P3Q6_RHIMU
MLFFKTLFPSYQRKLFFPFPFPFPFKPNSKNLCD